MTYTIFFRSFARAYETEGNAPWVRIYYNFKEQPMTPAHAVQLLVEEFPATYDVANHKKCGFMVQASTGESTKLHGPFFANVTKLPPQPPQTVVMVTKEKV